MLRNKELRLLAAALGLLGGGGILCALLGGPAPLTAALILAMAAAIFAYLHWRNRKLMALSDYLRRVTEGDYALEIRDNDEGELSILKSEIYKVTHALSVQSSALRQEKAFLADAISDISHQLKTPITSASILTDLIADPDMDAEKRAEFVQGIRTGLDRVQWLIQALLKLARLDAAAEAFQMTSLPLAELVEQSAVPLQIPMELREQSLEIVGDRGAVITGDPAWLTEAVGNVLKNCMEHSPRGGVITARLQQTALYTRLEILDTGPGISQEDLPHIFQRFYRGKRASKGGIGIGLALAQSIVKRHGGSLEAGNHPGGGARFTFNFYTPGPKTAG